MAFAIEFSERARRAFILAAELAAEDNSNTVTPDHLATATLAQREGLAARAVSKIQVSLEELFPTLPEDNPNPPNHPTPDQKAELGPEIKKLIDIAANRAEEMKHSYIGTEHILMAVLIEGTSQTAVTLTQAGIDADTFTAIVKEFLQGHSNSPRQTNSSPDRLAQTKSIAATALNQIRDAATDEEAKLQIATNALNHILQA